MKYKKIIATFCMIAVGMSLAGCGQKTEEANPNEDKLAVGTQLLTRGDIAQQVDLKGQVYAGNAVDILPKTTGKVDQVLVKVGETVDQGEMLIILENENQSAAFKQAQAAYDLVLVSARNAQAQYEDAQKNYQRMQELYAQGGISHQQLETQEIQMQMLDPGLSAAQVAQAEAALEMAQIQLQNTYVKAPIGGVVTSVTVEKGDMVGQMPIVSVADMDEVYIKTGVSPEQINLLEAGQTADVYIGDIMTEALEGTVQEISLDSGIQGTYGFKVYLDNGDHAIKPGMFAEVSLDLGTKENVLLLPKDAVRDTGLNTIVYRVQAEKAEAVIVKTGLSNSDQVEIVQGLTEGDEVIIKGAHLVKDGTPVDVVREEA